MITRRTVLAAGLAFPAVAWTTGLGGKAPTGPGRPDVRSIDALLIDETIEMPHPMPAFIDAGRQALSVVGIQLDAASHEGLMRVLSRSQAIVGISSGATLFCIERIAWDHGLRLTDRRQRRAGDPGDDTCWRDVAALLSGAPALAAGTLSDVRAYRPSRVDGALHAWVMQKNAGPRLHLGRGEA